MLPSMVSNGLKNMAEKTKIFGNSKFHHLNYFLSVGCARYIYVFFVNLCDVRCFCSVYQFYFIVVVFFNLSDGPKSKMVA